MSDTVRQSPVSPLNYSLCETTTKVAWIEQKKGCLSKRKARIHGYGSCFVVL